MDLINVRLNAAKSDFEAWLANRDTR